MSSIWKFFSGEDGEGEAAQPAPENAENAPPLAETEVKMKSKPAPKTAAAATRSGTPPAPGVADAGKPTASAANARYGIDDAIRLMRTLPVEENVDLVVRVMKSTLESLKVRVGDIIEDASRRQALLETNISEYKAQIVQFEREIEVRRHEIARHETDLAETTKVKERLQTAETLTGTPHAPHAGPGLGRSAPPLPVRSKPPPDVPKRPASIPPKNELVDVPAPSPSEPRDIEKPS